MWMGTDGAVAVSVSLEAVDESKDVILLELGVFLAELEGLHGGNGQA